MQLDRITIFAMLAALAHAHAAEHPPSKGPSLLRDPMIQPHGENREASYEAIPGDVGVAPPIGNATRYLFDPESRSAGRRGGPQERRNHHQSNNPKPYFATRRMMDGEKRLHRTRTGLTSSSDMEIVATVLSKLRGQKTAAGKVASRGVNIFQLTSTESAGILSMVGDENAGNPIPPEVL